MATGAERVGGRAAAGAKCRLIVVLSECDLAKIAQRGYAGSASTEHDARAGAVGTFISDSLIQGL